MDDAAVISGYSLCLPYAANASLLIENLKRGEQVNKSPWFRTDEEAVKCGFKSNAYVAQLPGTPDNDLALICRLIDQALQQAKLRQQDLRGENVRVYLTGAGPRIDVGDYKSFYDNNDIDDIKLTASIKKLDAKNMSQDAIAHQLAHYYQLRYMPPNIHGASNSSLVAIHLGCQAIEQGHIDLVVVINCSKIKSQDIWYLDNQAMLTSKIVQPFAEKSNNVLFSEGFCVMILERSQHRELRKMPAGVRLKSGYRQISSSRSNNNTWVSINMLKLMREVLTAADISPELLCAIIPHGNGTAISDKAEENALLSLLADWPVPVLAYKGQIGYVATGSGIIDLIIGDYSLCHHELLTPVGKPGAGANFSRHLLLNRGAVKHAKRHLLKTGIGMDGSVVAMVMAKDTLKEK